MTRILLPTLLLALANPAGAQNELPAVGTAPLSTTPAAEAGTTIIGERESPIGLYIMPWRESAPESGMDRPARLLQEKLMPVDEQVFVRQLEYYNALSGALKRKGVVTPGER